MDKNQEMTIRLDELRSRLIAQKTITVPVRFPMTTEKAALYLETAVQAEVMARGPRPLTILWE